MYCTVSCTQSLVTCLTCILFKCLMHASGFSEVYIKIFDILELDVAIVCTKYMLWSIFEYVHHESPNSSSV
jgi:hypothetical protein